MGGSRSDLIKYELENSTMGFSDMIHDLIDEVRSAPAKVQHKLARTAISALVSRSPVLTGRYVMSHRLEFGAADETYEDAEDYPQATDDHKPKTKRKTLPKDRRQFVNSAQATLFRKAGVPLHQEGANITSMHISNNVPYADKVEFLGWQNVGPYFVYTHSYNDVMAAIPDILSEIHSEIENNVKGKK